jgi:hypothetical protein
MASPFGTANTQQQQQQPQNNNNNHNYNNNSSSSMWSKLNLDSLKPLMAVPQRTVGYSLLASLVPQNSRVWDMVQRLYTPSADDALGAPALKSDLYGPCVVIAILGLIVSLQTLFAYVVSIIFLDFVLSYIVPPSNTTSSSSSGTDTSNASSSRWVTMAVSRSGYALFSLAAGLILRSFVASVFWWLALFGVVGLVDVSDLSLRTIVRCAAHFIFVLVVLWLY